MNDGDKDGDGIVDHADWHITNSAARFTPLTITLPEPLGAGMRLKLDYPDCPPGGAPATNRTMRLWTKRADQARDPRAFPDGDYLAPGVYTGAELVDLGFSDRTQNFGIEGIHSAANQAISIAVDPDGPGSADYVHSDQMRVSIIKVEFIDEVPDYSLDSNTDSDNFFLRQHDQTTGHADYTNLNIAYRIIPAGIDVSDVKINVYVEDTGTKVMFGSEDHLDGETDASGDFKTGDSLKVKWGDVRDSSGNFRNVGFCRLELEVYVDGSSTPICKTPIADADTSMPGWQCPQKGLGIHDLAYKHRPVVYVGANESNAPNGPVYPFSAGIKSHLRLRKDVFGPDGPAWASPPANYSTFSSFPIPAANFKDYEYRYPVIEASRDNDGANSGDHYIDIDDANRTCGLGVPFLCHRGHPSPSGAANYAFVQYWQYQSGSHSPYHLTLPVSNNKFVHEADWEMVQICVRLKDTSDAYNKSKWISPYAVTASQHYYGQTLAWRRNVNGPAILDQRYVTHVDDGNRINIFIAENAHATYFRGGTFEVTVTAGCGTQIQYNPTYSLYYDEVAAPFTQIDCDLLPFNYKAASGVNMKAICDWNGNWGEEPTFTPAIPGPFRRTVNIDGGGGSFALNDDPVQFHNRCRKIISGSQDSETGL